MANNLYVQIGLVLLIALSAKNAILIVEMARQGRAAGKSIVEATVEASQIRFRPILMTSFTFILGVLPLVFASGAGASARKSLGLAVATGMLASTCLAVLFVPAFYVVLQRWAERKAGHRSRCGGEVTNCARVKLPAPSDWRASRNQPPARFSAIASLIRCSRIACSFWYCSGERICCICGAVWL